MQSHLNPKRAACALLIGADFDGATLHRADFRQAVGGRFDVNRIANFTLARLSNARFDQASMRSAVLTDANLRWTDLRGANIESANLEGADLLGANISGMKYKLARLSGARWVNGIICRPGSVGVGLF